MTNTEIKFGNYAAEPRTDGYYLRHPNGGGAMATLVESEKRSKGFNPDK